MSSETEKIRIEPDEAIEPGEVVELHFRSVGMMWIQAAQLAAIEYFIGKRRKEFTILSHSIPEKNKAVFKVRVNKTNPVIVTALVIAGAISAVGVVAWLTLDKVYKIVKSPAGAVMMGGFGSLALIAAITTLLGLFKKK